MRGQLSLEFLLTMTAFVSMLALAVPAVGNAKNAGDWALAVRSAELSLDRLSAACERALITGAEENLTLTQFGNFSLMTNSTRIALNVTAAGKNKIIGAASAGNCVFEVKNSSSGRANILVRANFS